MMTKVVGVVTLAVILAIGLAYGLAPRARLSTTIDIAAPPSRVWAVLMDTRRYPEWNPNMRLVGSLVPGAVIENVEGHGDDQMIFWPPVVTVHPQQELRWVGHYKVQGILDAEHYFLLRPQGAGTVVTQGETFRGVALWLFDVQSLLPNFVTLNMALKARAEAS